MREKGRELNIELMLNEVSSKHCCCFLFHWYCRSASAGSLRQRHACLPLLCKDSCGWTAQNGLVSSHFPTVQHAHRPFGTNTFVAKLSYSSSFFHDGHQRSLNNFCAKDNRDVKEKTKSKDSEKASNSFFEGTSERAEEGVGKERHANTKAPGDEEQECDIDDFCNHPGFRFFSHAPNSMMIFSRGADRKQDNPLQTYLPEPCRESAVLEIPQNREQTKEVMEEVKRISHRELRAEIERDAKDGSAAIPPLTPIGWSVEHNPGTRFFFNAKGASFPFHECQQQ